LEKANLTRLEKPNLPRLEQQHPKAEASAERKRRLPVSALQQQPEEEEAGAEGKTV